MEEIGILKGNTNAKNIIIPKRKEDLIDYEEINKKIIKGWSMFKSSIERTIYFYFLFYPKSNVKIGFSPSYLENVIHIKKSSAQEGVRRLIEKGYLQQVEENSQDYIFIEDPLFTPEIKVKEPISNPRESKPIKKIKSLLDINEISYEEEIFFTDCIFKDTGCFGYFDLMINNQYLIEYDGEQHFKIVQFWGGETGYQKRHKHDLAKNKYCFDNNIPLIRIPFDAKYDLNDLKLETTRFLLTPENEEEYYKTRIKE